MNVLLASPLVVLAPLVVIPAPPQSAVTAAPPATAAVPAQPPAGATTPAAFKEPIPTAAFSIEMVPIPGSADGTIKPFYMSTTEITWEAFDVFVYEADTQAGGTPKGVDAVSRPTKPYIPPDRGYGHEGYAALSMTAMSADKFCAWLSATSGRTYRLPSEAQWEHAARAGRDAGVDAASLAASEWTAANSNDAPHPVGAKPANAWGLHDMLGNVSEWVVAKDGKHVVKGSSFRDKPEDITIGARREQDATWNVSDPQVPKSRWWLPDAPFVGMRVVCEDAPRAKP